MHKSAVQLVACALGSKHLQFDSGAICASVSIHGEE